MAGDGESGLEKFTVPEKEAVPVKETPRGDGAPPDRVPPPSEVPLHLALIPVVFLIAALSLSVLVWKLPPHLALIAATAVAFLCSSRLGITWTQSLDGMVKAIGMALPACLILLVVGILIGTWILAGVVPTLIVYGLKILTPKLFLPATCLVCAVVSLSTGSSWSTAGTVGVALVGVGAGLGISPAMTAGAIISGSYFGDKLSPLSDTTNLAPAVAGSQLFDHIRHMLYTTLPSLAIAVIIYSVMGFWFKTGGANAEKVELVVRTVEKNFYVGIVLLVPAVAVIAMVAAKVPALPALFIGCVLGGAFAMSYQDASLGEVLKVAQEGFKPATKVAAVNELLKRGGLESMLKTVALVIAALAFGGAMERGGLLQRLAAAILSLVRGVGSLVAATLLSCIGMNVLAGEQYMSIVIPGRMYQPAYKKRGLHPKNLSRALEDAGTLTSPLVPWNSCGAYMAVTLGVSPLAYLPYAFLNLLNPLVSAFYGFTGITMHKLEDQPGEKSAVSGEETEGAALKESGELDEVGESEERRESGEGEGEESEEEVDLLDGEEDKEGEGKKPGADSQEDKDRD